MSDNNKPVTRGLAELRSRIQTNDDIKAISLQIRDHEGHIISVYFEQYNYPKHVYIMGNLSSDRFRNYKDENGNYALVPVNMAENFLNERCSFWEICSANEIYTNTDTCDNNPTGINTPVYHIRMSVEGEASPKVFVELNKDPDVHEVLNLDNVTLNVTGASFEASVFTIDHWKIPWFVGIMQGTITRYADRNLEAAKAALKGSKKIPAIKYQDGVEPLEMDFREQSVIIKQ